MNKHLEYTPIDTARRLAAAATLTAIALAGCSREAGSTHRPHSRGARPAAARVVSSPPMKPCFDKPIPEPRPPKTSIAPTDYSSPNFTMQLQRWNVKKKQSMQVTSPAKLVLKALDKNTLVGDPFGPPDYTQNAVSAATVKVINGQSYGSGFEARGRNGNKVIVTAAHVIEDATGPIHVVDDQGKSTEVTSGCYVYQYHGKRMPLKPNASDTEPTGIDDIAILNTKQQLDGKPLSVSSKPPARGKWVSFTNNQQTLIDGSVSDGDPTSPTEFSGMVLTNPANYMGFMALTGIQPWLGKDLTSTYSLMPGGSGGEVTVGKTVVGITVTSAQEHADLANGIIDYITPDALSQDYNVSMDPRVAHIQGMLPNDAGLVAGSQINFALAGGDY